MSDTQRLGEIITDVAVAQSRIKHVLKQACDCNAYNRDYNKARTELIEAQYAVKRALYRLQAIATKEYSR